MGFSSMLETQFVTQHDESLVLITDGAPYLSHSFSSPSSFAPQLLLAASAMSHCSDAITGGDAAKHSKLLLRLFAFKFVFGVLKRTLAGLFSRAPARPLACLLPFLFRVPLDPRTWRALWLQAKR